MRKLLLLTIVMFITVLGYAQGEYATVNIYKKSAQEASFYMDGKLMGKLKKGHLEYKVYNPRSVKITITNNKNYNNEFSIKLEKGKDYFLEVVQLKPSYKGYILESISMPPVENAFYEEEKKGDDK